MKWSNFRVAVVNAFLASKGKPVSRKLVKSIITAACVYAIVFVVAKLGYKQSEADTAIIAQAAAAVGAFVSGWLTTEFPQIVQDDTPEPAPPRADPAPEPAPAVNMVVTLPADAPTPNIVLKSPEAAPEADTVTMPAVQDQPNYPKREGPRTVI